MKQLTLAIVTNNFILYTSEKISVQAYKMCDLSLKTHNQTTNSVARRWTSFFILNP